MSKRRRFGRVRKLPSGRYQARYPGPDGLDRPAPETFATKRDAETWLVTTEAEMLADDWINPDAGRIPFGDYATQWIDERPDLRPKTVELYRYLLRRHLTPTFGTKAMADIKEPHVRRWRKALLEAGVSAITVAKAYRLIKAIFATAVDDGVIRRNPCRIKGAGQEKSAERPVLTVPQVFALAEAIGPRYQALVLMGALTSLRWGELCALRQADVDLEGRTVRVERTLTELQGGGLTFGPPKSEAGKRTVSFPDLVSPVLRWHLSCFTPGGEDDLIFTSPNGTPLRRGNFRQRVWLPALKAADLPSIHFHDLRHTGNHLTASAGASLRELMARMGHSSTRAALIYQHSTDERQREIADALGQLARDELKRGKGKAAGRGPGNRSGTQRARHRRSAS
jgi:integrase